jgi:hypothetical protein
VRSPALLLVAALVAAATPSLTAAPAAAAPPDEAAPDDVAAPVAPATPDPTCETPAAADGDEPPCNPHLSDAAWSGSHRNSYAQASSPFPGPAGPAEHVNVDRLGTAAAPIVLSYSPEYPDGRRVIWASTVGNTGEVLKIDPEEVTIIDKYLPQVQEGEGPGEASVSGAYNLVDADNRLHVGKASAVEVYGDAVPDRADSSIVLLHRFDLPDEAMCGEDQLVGITMTYDGYVAFATENGVVGLLPRDPSLMDADHLRTWSANGDDCAGGPDGELETVSNSIAADEDGGVYVVTSHAMYRLDWDGQELEEGWRSGYAGAGGSGAGRLGEGSGATPSVMGTGDDEDRFVVITDGQELMHLVLLWRDGIPADWEPIREGADRRIACEVPVTFGDPDAERSLSEQSVLVRGHDAVVVNNLMQFDEVLGQFPPQFAPYAQLLSGLEGNAPTGLERFAWDPETRTCDVVWANPDIAIPNGIPTMSVETGLIYGIGSRDGVWTLEGVDWDTGEVELTVETAPFPTNNSFYAATTIGHDGTVWTGNFGGVTRFQPCDPEEEADCGRRLDPAEALLGQLPTDPEGLTRHLVGLPNDDPEGAAEDGQDPGSEDEAAADAGDDGAGGSPGSGADGADDGASAASPASTPLPATGGSTGLLGLLALLAAWSLRRGTDRASGGEAATSLTGPMPRG